MRFLIISHVPHKVDGETILAYAPYVREMNLWLKYVNKVDILALKTEEMPTDIEIPYEYKNIVFNRIPAIQFTSLKTIITSFFYLPTILISIFKSCKKSDHIHLRCPGNIGLLGCFIQILFPKKIKTAKYAGNWDPKAKQPFSYRLQKWILSNTFLTKNMTVLVYGAWENQSKNIKPFFTASFLNSEIEKPQERNYHEKLNFVFIGSLVKGKRPLLAIKIIEALQKQGKNVKLDIYGEGVLMSEIKQYITDNHLETVISLKGNQDKEVIKKALKSAHFLILLSKSEGWPKAIAEGMFFGVIPIATSISCVPYMLDYGNRGILVKPDFEDVLDKINAHLKDEKALKTMSKQAVNWSQNYTLDVFETEISKLLKHR